MSTELVTVSPEMPLDEALDLMRWEHVRHLLVLQGETLLGVVSDRDLSTYHSLVHDGASTPLGSIGRAPHCVCAPDTPLSVAARVLLESHRDAVVVVDEGRAAGIFTTTDALRHLATVEC